MGSDAFVEHLRPQLREASLDPNLLRRECDVARPRLEELFSGALDKITQDRLIYEATRVYHYKLQEVGAHLGLHYSTISVIAKRVAEANQDSNIKA